MRELLPFLESQLKPPKGSRHAVRVHDPKTGQEVVITSDEPILAFGLDDESRVWWKHGEPHTDAVIIAEWDGEPAIVFVDITASVQLKVRKATAARAASVTDPMARKERQLDGMIDHFHPSARTGGVRTEGDEHHDAWRDGHDRPPILPTANHRVGAIVVGFHQQARRPLGPRMVGGRRVQRAVWSPVPSSRNRAVIDFSDIAVQLGW